MTLRLQLEQVQTDGSHSMAHQPRPSAADWALCDAIARAHGKSFYLAGSLLPPDRRRAVRAAYAYCRIADDIIDRGTGKSATEVLAELQAWQNQIDTPIHPIARAFWHARREYDVPEEPVYHLLDGLRSDLTINRYEHWDHLRQYCYQVAGTVGLIVAPILGCQQQWALSHAAELGIAMQLTNILRDVAEDAEMGRVYLPLDELAAFRIDPADVLLGRPGPHFEDLVRFQVDRARSIYKSALQGVPALSAGGRFATLLAAELYSGILDEIERRKYDVFSGRARVSCAAKAWKVVVVSAQFVRLTSSGSALRQDELSEELLPQRSELRI